MDTVYNPAGIIPVVIVAIHPPPGKQTGCKQLYYGHCHVGKSDTIIVPTLETTFAA